MAGRAYRPAIRVFIPIVSKPSASKPSVSQPCVSKQGLTISVTEQKD
jgi:hypothetical protein